MELPITSRINQLGQPVADPEQHFQAMMVPALNRTPMAPQPWLDVSQEQGIDRAAVPKNSAPCDKRHGVIRRLCLLAFVLAQTWLATTSMVTVLPYQRRAPLEIVIVILFVIL